MDGNDNEMNAANKIKLRGDTFYENAPPKSKFTDETEIMVN